MKEATLAGRKVWMVPHLNSVMGTWCAGCTFARPELTYPRNCVVNDSPRSCGPDHAIYIEQTDEAMAAYVAARINT